jgi:hypothetical protein
MAEATPGTDKAMLEALVESTLRANANRANIAHEMAEVIRDLMRAVSSDDNNGYKAAEQMERMLKYLVRCKEPLSWWEIFSDALKIIRENLPERDYHEGYLSVAKSGIKYFVESSADDAAAAGRSAKRLSDFQREISWLERPKHTTPERERTRQILADNAKRLAGKSK